MIDARDVRYTYPNRVDALTGVSFSLPSGKKYALVGANGAGKSTLLSLLCALDYPQGGSMHIGGLPLDKDHTQQIRDMVGMVFQNPDDQLFMPTVYDDVAFSLRNRGMNERDVAAQVHALLDDMNVSHLKDRPPYRLSGGEKRMAAIATALSIKPKLLLMDEPTAFLDPRARKHFISLMQKLDVGMLIATHDLHLAREHMDGVLILKEGRIFAQGETALLDDPQLLQDALLA